LSDSETHVNSAHLPGDEGLWFFLAADAVLFALLFGSFSFYRVQDEVLFNTAQQLLHPDYAVVNTIFLLSSSWLVAMCINYARNNLLERAALYMGLAILFGIAFAVTKCIEYMMIVKAGSNLITNQFLMYYFTITGIHFLHVIAGLCALIVCFHKLKTAGRIQQDIPFLESAASFWHIVDILWLFIFPLLYLMH